ncbi:MAG TPA: DJ-1 family glyoxalase III [Polyangiaceae bacterium]|jgi:protein DJ-1|nr:DJ-1 family glyoxalase III [Polyangiaceae bacterium]
MTSRALLLLATGAEEMEVAIAADVMRRAGIEVTVAGVDGAQPVRCSRGLLITPDLDLNDAQGKYDALVLPGGAAGAGRLCASAQVGKLLREQEASGLLLAAICAAPSALKAHGVFAGKRMTIYPGMENEIVGHGQVEHDRVVIDGNLITSRGPGTAFEFALAIVECLQGAKIAQQVEGPLLLGRRGDS